MQEEVDKLVRKGAIKEVSPAPGQFVSRIFMVPKKGGSVRPVVNLRPLNKFVAKKKFKMENSAVLRDLIKPKDWMTSIDLKDTFLSVPMAAHHWKLLRFMCGGRLYEFQCLPFGLTSAPRTLTKVMKPVMAVLRRRGIRSMIFLDDLLLLSSSKEELAEITKEVIILLQRLGFLINEEKSTLVPTQIMAYLGFLLDSVRMTISPTPGQAGGNSGGLQEDTGADPCVGAGHGEADWEDVSRLASDSPGPVVLPQLTKGKECCLQSL